MKKIMVIILFLLLTGCKKTNTAPMIVEKYLNAYINVSDDIINNINKVVDENDDFNITNKKMYKKILLRQYKDLKYTILTEEYDADKALITVNINVYDLNKADTNATNYLSSHLGDFYDENGNFNNAKYINYKLNIMYEAQDRIDYQIVFFLKNKKGLWILEQPTDDDLKKIHGIYINN